MHTPTIAVIMATYNGQKYISKQLDSILAQTYSNIVIYIRDDCSSDNTMDIISKYKQKYSHKFIINKNKQNLGFVKNFELLLSEVDYDYIAISDQDDIWKPNKLEKELKAMMEIEKDNPNLAIMVHSDLEIIDSDENQICKSFFKKKGYSLSHSKDLGQILGPCGVMGNTILMNKNLKNIALPFSANIEFHDYYLAVINEIYGKRITLNEPLVQYRIHLDNTSNNNILKLEKNKYRGLPFLNTGKAMCLKSLNKDNINIEDLNIINFFLDYLECKDYAFSYYFSLLSNNLVKKGFWYRFKLFFKFIINTPLSKIMLR
ncbi:glycosyltransferase family 2 protein [Campylobacter porcelli]|uniref:Glycosyltransferase family 2 protein n=2 Tax=Campylobacter TaxID=194 RepID=A0ABU7M6A8_9BACT|nr:glycosyltransferase family 2 protein [Campylobacter sp. P0124]MEE3705528.1 glycosyltransferase family 2 protein [Campylobacter sp. CX2-8023-23]MEE3745237.1 glycosyltransferase family 2 protein [Campylobacter sp. CX2-4855-23]